MGRFFISTLYTWNPVQLGVAAHDGRRPPRFVKAGRPVTPYPQGSGWRTLPPASLPSDTAVNAFICAPPPSLSSVHSRPAFGSPSQGIKVDASYASVLPLPFDGKSNKLVSEKGRAGSQCVLGFNVLAVSGLKIGEGVCWNGRFMANLPGDVFSARAERLLPQRASIPPVHSTVAFPRSSSQSQKHTEYPAFSHAYQPPHLARKKYRRKDIVAQQRAFMPNPRARPLRNCSSTGLQPPASSGRAARAPRASPAACPARQLGLVYLARIFALSVDGWDTAAHRCV